LQSFLRGKELFSSQNYLKGNPSGKGNPQESSAAKLAAHAGMPSPQSLSDKTS